MANLTNRALLIAVALGLATVVLMLAPLRLGLGGMFLSTFSLVPVFAAVLTLGPRLGAVSAIIATGVLALFAGTQPALAMAALTVLPALVIGHTVGLSRTEGEVVEWFPLSSVMMAVGVVAAATMVLYGLLMGFDAETLRAQVGDAVGRMTQDGQIPPQLQETSPERVADLLARFLPFLMPFSLTLMLLVSLHLGERLARRLGPVERPPADLPAEIGLPQVAFVGFVLFAVLATMDGTLGIVGRVFAGAFGALFAIVGLATIHFLTRGNPARGFILGAVYFGAFLFSFSILAFIALGIAETLLGLRARRAARH